MDGIESGSLPLLQLEEEPVCSAEIMVSFSCWSRKLLWFSIQVTTYQKQYFYTDSLDSATEFVRAIADDIKRPFSVRFYNRFSSLSHSVTAYQVQPVHPNSGGVEQLWQDLGHGKGVEGGPGNRGECIEESTEDSIKELYFIHVVQESAGERWGAWSFCRFHFPHCWPRHIPLWVKVFPFAMFSSDLYGRP